MVQIFKMTFDSTGGMVACGAMPISFDSEADANRFMEHYLEHAFAGGKCGYRLDDEYWWGCDETPDLQLHRFTIDQWAPSLQTLAEGAERG
jgi:hypothetical protein